MSNTPGISPLTPDIEDVRYSGDDGYKDPSEPMGAPETLDEAGDADQSDAPETRERDTGKGPLTP